MSIGTDVIFTTSSGAYTTNASETSPHWIRAGTPVYLAGGGRGIVVPVTADSGQTVVMPVMDSREISDVRSPAAGRKRDRISPVDAWGD